MPVAKVIKASKDTKAGIIFATSSHDGRVVVSKIRDDGLFAKTKIKPGQRVKKINKIPIKKGMKLIDVVNIIRNTEGGEEITVVTEPDKITTKVTKPTKDSKVGIILVKKGNNIIVQSLVDGGLFSNNPKNKVKPYQRVISINGVKMKDDTATADAINLLKKAKSDITLVTSTTTSSSSSVPISIVGDTTEVHVTCDKTTGNKCKINREVPSMLVPYYGSGEPIVTASDEKEWTDFCDRVDGILNDTINNNSSPSSTTSPSSSSSGPSPIICCLITSIILGIVLFLFISMLLGIVVVGIGVGLYCKSNSVNSEKNTAICSDRLTLLCYEFNDQASTKDKGLKYEAKTVVAGKSGDFERSPVDVLRRGIARLMPIRRFLDIKRPEWFGA